MGYYKIGEWQKCF